MLPIFLPPSWPDITENQKLTSSIFTEMLGCVIPTLFPKLWKLKLENLAGTSKELTQYSGSLGEFTRAPASPMFYSRKWLCLWHSCHKLQTRKSTRLPLLSSLHYLKAFWALHLESSQLSELWTQKLDLYIVCSNACYFPILLIVYQSLLVNDIYCPHHTKP